MSTIKDYIAQVEKTNREVYGYNGNVTNSPSYVTLWSIESLTDVDLAKKTLSKINRMREKAGSVLIDVPYGHRLF